MKSGSPPHLGVTGLFSYSPATRLLIGSDRFVVAALTRTVRGLVSELELTVADDGVPSDCVVSFDNIHTIPRDTFRRKIVQLNAKKMAQACQHLRDATGC